MKGWVYVITNKAMPRLVKVGFSTKDPELRAAELNHTGSPHPYEVNYEVLVTEPREVEQTVHARLRDNGKLEGKEWFCCTVEEAIGIIRSVVGIKALLENHKLTGQESVEVKKETLFEVKRQQVVTKYEPLLAATSPGTEYKSLMARRDAEIAAEITALKKTLCADAAMINRSPVSLPVATPQTIGTYCARCRKLYSSQRCPTCGN